MTKKSDETYIRYEALRVQLAALACSFYQAAKHFPGVHYRILEASGTTEIAQWSRWIDANRTADESHEGWDIYPAAWIACTLEKLSKLEARTESDRCGLYRSACGNLREARIELENLADTGTKILGALEQECDRNDKLRDKATFGVVYPGYRGWLEAVRLTGERHRNAYVNVKNPFWGAEGDNMLAEARAMGRQMAEDNWAKTYNLPQPLRFSVCQITPDIFTASANAIRLWLEGGIYEPIEHIVLKVEPISIPGMVSPDKVLAIVRGDGAVRSEIPVKKISRKRGRPRGSRVRQKEDKRIYDGYYSHVPRITKAEYAREINKDERFVVLAIDRERKNRRCRKLKSSGWAK